MRFSLSTNWCNRRLEGGEEIADAAEELGFDGLELGFHTTQRQVAGIRARLDRMPVGSIHAFCPVPISAPEGYPELYQLADFDEGMRALARVHVVKNIEFASSLGADTVVLHAGRVPCASWFRRIHDRRRLKRGMKLVPILKAELDSLMPVLEKNRVTLALENLPYAEGFPNEDETRALLADDFGGFVKAWFDTGHDFVRRSAGWSASPLANGLVAGMHINDSAGGDDHLPPGEGKVDFAALKSLAQSVRHVVFEPHEGVAAEALAKGLAHLKELWK